MQYSLSSMLIITPRTGPLCRRRVSFPRRTSTSYARSKGRDLIEDQRPCFCILFLCLVAAGSFAGRQTLRPGRAPRGSQHTKSRLFMFARGTHSVGFLTVRHFSWNGKKMLQPTKPSCQTLLTQSQVTSGFGHGNERLGLAFLTYGSLHRKKPLRE